MKVDVCDRNVFDLAGPKHLLSRRLIPKDKQAFLATLVQAVYVAETDRLQGRQGLLALAPKWWSELGYEPLSFIHEDQGSGPIIAAVFRRTEKAMDSEEDNGSSKKEVEKSEQYSEVAPLMVVALRGTIVHHTESLQRDMLANLYMVSNKLHTTTRYSLALESIRAIILKVDHRDVSLAGHSLGASLVLLVGQTLASEGMLVDTHLFNPPFPSPPLERIKSHRWKLALNLAGMACSTGLSHLLLDASKRQSLYQTFLALKGWFPHLYINPQDSVCSAYIGYFSSRDFMKRIGAGPLAELAAPFSFQGTLQHYFAGECKAFHLIPCAHLHVVGKSYAELVRAHGLHQWWLPDLEVDYQEVKVGMDEQQGIVDTVLSGDAHTQPS